MLAGDYPCYSYLAHDRGIDPSCRLCSNLSVSNYLPPEENIEHLVARCRATADTRDRMIPNLFNLVSQYDPQHSLLNKCAHSTLTQFILDCTSLNLPAGYRISPKHTMFRNIARQCSDIIYAIHMDRTRQLRELNLLRS